jgi:hypothetical protein
MAMLGVVVIIIIEQSRAEQGRTEQRRRGLKRTMRICCCVAVGLAVDRLKEEGEVEVEGQDWYIFNVT